MGTFDILIRHRAEFLGGLTVTLQLCLWIWPVGIVLGGALGVAGARWRRWVGSTSRAVSFFFSGIPILVLLFWLHYPAQTLLGIIVDPFWTAVAALGAVNTLLVADLVRGTLIDFPGQYVLAARACGLRPAETVLKIQFPIVLRQLLPSLLFMQVTMLQATLFASLISVDEVFRIAQRVNSQVYRPVEIYSALAVLFLLICLPLNGAAVFLRARFTRNLSEQ